MLPPQFQTLPLSRARALFSHSDWIFEIKSDGFKALLYSDEDGIRLISRNLEGIVAKRKSHPYLPEHATWLKIRNREYSQWIGREELFERERESDPDFQVWDGYALACETAQGLR
jgi:ATP-dependent DNA ligase